jgi:hypothetical protein
MYVIQAWPAHGDPELHESFFVSSTLAMEACYSSLCDHVAGTMEKPEEIKWDYDGFTGAYIGTTEYGIDYEIYRLKPSG